jgi:hypothetical protein
VGETAIIDCLRARLDRAGFLTHVVDAEAGRPSLVAVAPGDQGSLRSAL